MKGDIVYLLRTPGDMEDYENDGLVIGVYYSYEEAYRDGCAEFGEDSFCEYGEADDYGQWYIDDRTVV